MQNLMQFKFKEIQKILSEEWDPIPSAPTDEYDSYIHRIISMFLEGGLSQENLTQYLVSLEEGFSNPVNLEDTNRVSEKVLTILNR